MSLTTGVPFAPSNPSVSLPIPAAAPPAALATAPSALGLLKCLRRCWGRAAAVGVVVAAGAAVVAWNVIPPSKHSARTIVYLPSGDLVFSAGQRGMTAERQRIQAQLAKSRPVLNAALRRPGIGALVPQPNALEWLEKEVQVDFPVPDFIRISISGDDPEVLAKLVVALREAYRSEVYDKVWAERNKRWDTLVTQKDAYVKQLRVKNGVAAGLEAKGASRDPAVRGLMQTFNQMQLNWYERDLIQTESDLNRSKIELALKQSDEKALATAVIADADIQALVNKDPLVVKGQEQVKALRDFIADFVSKSAKGEATPTLQPYRKQLAEAEQSLEKLKKDQAPRVVAAWRAAQIAAAADAARQLQIRITMLTETDKSLGAKVDGLRNGIQTANENNAELDRNRESTASLEAVLKTISDEEAKLRFEIDANPVRFEIQEEATVLSAADDKRRLMGTAGTFGGTFAFLLLAFAFLEFRARRINSVEEIVHGLGMNLIGTVPDTATQPSGSRTAAAGDDPLHSTFAEAIDATRVMLLQAARSESLRVVMVTSASSGEGKTSLSTHLAASLAQTNLRVLLIDGDLRNPIVHQIFGLDMAPGLCELLRGEAAPEAVIRSTSVDRLSLIPAGRWSNGASRALAQDGVAGQLLRQFRDEFDFVIIDSSPVLPVADPLLIGQMADGTIISVLRDVSRMPNVYAAHQRLTAGGVRVLGAVVNGVRGEVYGAAYPYRVRVGA
jgi:succinoglycan biosynthesis transport protein ExoP